MDLVFGQSPVRAILQKITETLLDLLLCITRVGPAKTIAMQCNAKQWGAMNTKQWDAMNAKTMQKTMRRN